MTKKYKLDHIAKIEGHAGFVGSILDGKMEDAKLEVKIGIRLFERLVINRPFEDIPVMVARVCGVCPVVHHLTSIKALEKAMDIKPSVQTIKLRKIMQHGQLIHSHSLHVFFLALADFFKLKHDVDLIKKFPDYTETALKVRDYGNNIVRKIGGRAVHPVSSVVGGFLKLPSKETLQELLDEQKEVLKIVSELGELFSKLNYPNFERKTEYVTLQNKNEYAIYEGDVISNMGLKVEPSDYESHVEEIHKPFEVVKRVKRDGREIFVGALPRINNNYNKLSPGAKKLIKNSGFKFPNYNTFLNVFAQVVEIVHCIEETGEWLKELLDSKQTKAITDYKVKAGKGAGIIEAPRGILYHYYEVDKQGIVRNSNIITPTAQFISNLEKDVEAFFPQTKNMTNENRRRKIQMLIRAYDPCMTCTVH